MSHLDYAPKQLMSGRLRRWVAAAVAVLLVVGAAVLGQATIAAAATPPGVATSILQNGSPMQPGAEVRSGDSLKLRVQYTAAAVGQELTISLGAGVSVAPTFPNNEAIESFTPTADGVIIKFKDPWPNISQGILDLDLVAAPVDTTAPGTISWNDGDEYSIPVIFVKDGDQKQNVGDGFAKTVNRTNLDSFIQKDGDGNYLGLNPDVANQVLDYTLTVSTPAGATRPDGFPVSDLLPSGLEYVAPLAVTGTETTWDENGYNPTNGPRSFAIDAETAASFDGHVVGELVGPSVLRLTYSVRVSDVSALDTALQAAFDARNGMPGNYEINLTNTATFGTTTEATANVRLRGTVLGPCPTCNGDFGKTGDLTTVTSLTNADGSLIEPVDITYTLRANLAQWDGHSDNYTLDDNVVIEDNLLSQASWLTGAGFLAVTGTGPITTLTEADSCSATAAAFAADAFVGQYCVTGQKLLINVGKNPATNLTIAAKARLNSVAGLPTVGEVEGGERYRVRNTATYTWGSSSTTTRNVDGFVVVPESSGEGVTDLSAFAKTAPERLSTVPGTPMQVPYTFTVNSGRTGVPAASTRIVDYVDTRYFDLAPDLSNVTLAGTYSGGVTLVASDFVLTRTGDNLEIVLSTSGQTKVAAANGVLTVNLTLTTRPFDGKETIDLVNRAALYGEGPDPLFVAEVEAQGTSFGAESETRKHVFDRVTNGGEWSQLLASDQDGDPVYVYRLQFIGHPGFGGVAIDPEVDVLPDGLEFVGFVAEADKATGAAAVPGPVDVEGNLTASFDPTAGPNGTITLAQQPGTTFPDGTTASVYFAARVTDDHEVIVNKFGISSTTIVPTEPSIDIEKWTDEGSDSGPTYDEYGALTNDGYPGDFDSAPGKTLTAGKTQQIHFTVSNDGPEPLRDIVVSDSLISGSGTITDLACTFPGSTEEEPLVGTEWAGQFEPGTQFECEGTLPALAPGQTHENTASVAAVGVLSGREVGDADDWNGKTAPATPAPSDPDEQLASTGGTIATGLIGVAALGIIAGITLLMIRRRGRHTV